MDRQEFNFPLTASQLLFWSGQQFYPDSPIYNVPYVFNIKGHISGELFAQAFSQLIENTEAFRIIFKNENENTSQIVNTESDFKLPILDFQDKTKEQLTDWILSRSKKVFILEKSLFDAALIQISEQEFIWYLNMHHLITDASSAQIIFNKLSGYYHCLEKGKSIPDDQVLRYSDYVNIERRAIESKNYRICKNYWSDKLSHKWALPKIYGNRTDLTTTRARRYSVRLGMERSDRLRELSNFPENRMFTDQMSIYNLFAAIFFSYLRLVSSDDTISFGSPVHNRNTGNFKSIPGLFIEVLPMMGEISLTDSFSKILKQTKNIFFEFMQHVESGLASSQIGRSFNCVLNYLPWNFSSFAGMASEAEWIHPGHCDANHHLRCHIIDHRNTGEIELAFDINEAVFSEKEAQKVPNHFLNLIDCVLINPEEVISDFSIITKEEKNWFLDQNGEGEPEYLDHDLIGRIREMANNYPEAIAIEFGDRLITYQELNRRTDQLASYLLQNDIGKGTNIGVHLYRSPEYVMAVIATMKAGACFVPLPMDLPDERLAFILDDSDCKVCITHDAQNSKLKLPREKIISAALIEELAAQETEFAEWPVKNSEDIVYQLYTSGSTGKPKGVMVPFRAMENYLNWASVYYDIQNSTIFPLFTSIGFDLTISSTFLPLLNGGKLIIYQEPGFGPDISLFKVFAENKVNAIKLTPSHLTLIKDRDLANLKLKLIIVGGEDFKANQAKELNEALAGQAAIYNEYGPTEATVGCIVSRYDSKIHTSTSVPIGSPISNMNAYILGSNLKMLPKGVVGEIFLSGKSLALGYRNLANMTKEKFLDNPFIEGEKMYRTGDLARWDNNGEMEYLGRSDEQIKLRGFRIEISDIESNMIAHQMIDNAAVILKSEVAEDSSTLIENCAECGLPSNYPNSDFNDEGVCHLCSTFGSYKDKTEKYFKSEDELKSLLLTPREDKSKYDCLSLLSGGKDSTYVLARLVDMGLNVLAFTLDNGYISDQAKTNINNIVAKLGIDHIYGETSHMNEIFVDSLNRHANVCNGCFKTIYTLSTQIALDKNIPFIVTGLSRGQFFETRLTEELFWDNTLNKSSIDDTILEARKIYHMENDAVKELLDVSMFENESTYDKVQFIDFYRYCDVSLEDMLTFLKEKIDWQRPTDTGRSTNCLINQLGIYVHKKEKGYSNYAFPYSWDVRLGHKTRNESLDEINEELDEVAVKRIMKEIGYSERDKIDVNQELLVGYYSGDQNLSSSEIRSYLSSKIPSYMIPDIFKYTEELPLNSHGKVDKAILKNLNATQLSLESSFVAPRNEIEELIEGIWSEVLVLKKVGVHDSFIELGGHSLAAIRITTRINEELGLQFPLIKIFELPTISQYAEYVEQTLVELMDKDA